MGVAGPGQPVRGVGGAYDNSVYRDATAGGLRERIIEDYLEADCPTTLPLGGFYNPVKPICDVYQNVFRGSFGREIKLADKVNGKDANQGLFDPVREVW